MNQRGKSLAFLGALMVAAGAFGLYAYFGVKKPSERADEQKAIDEKLFAPDVTFDSLTVVAKGDTTALESTDGGWRITSPVQAAGDKFTVDAIVSQIRTAKVKRVVEESPTPEDLARYGLTPPHFEVKVGYVPPGKTERATVSFSGGLENTFDGSVFLQRVGDPRVFSAEGGLRWTFEKTTFDLRDKEVLAFEPAAVRKVEVKAKAQSYVLEQDDEKHWKLTQPFAADADAMTVGGIFGSLKSERAVAFLPPDRQAALGFDQPLTDARLTFKDGSSVRLRWVKTPSEGGAEKAYLLREKDTDTTLAEVTLASVTHLAKPPAELKDKTALVFKRALVARLSFKPAGTGAALVLGRVAADAGADEWEVLAPEKRPAQRFKVSSALWNLEALKATALGPEAPKDWKAFGLGPEARRVTLMDAQGKTLTELVIGKELPNKANTIYARGTRNQVLELDTARLADLPSQVADVTAAAPAPPSPAN
jgi:hypothetical protein